MHYFYASQIYSEALKVRRIITVDDLHIEPVSYSKGHPGVLGNKGTWPFTFREQWNKSKRKLGTREQKHILGNREYQN